MSQDENKAPNSSQALCAIGIALLSALFFTLTYVLNRVSATEGGHWAWTASLRYLITLPLLLPLMPWQAGIAPVWRSICNSPLAWLRCSTIGFVLFYTLLSYAASSGPSWLIAGSFQFTVIAGMLCAPVIYHDERRKIPIAAILIAILMLIGVWLMQVGYHNGPMQSSAWIALACVLLAAIAYPLGNRLLLLHLEHTQESLTATQRVFGMTLVSQPLWIGLAYWGWSQVGLPSSTQIWLASGVALSAGVIASILFFQATGMVKRNPVALGAAESMQATELLFSILLGSLFLGESWPQGSSLFGAIAIMIGIVGFAILVTKKKS